MSPFSIETLGEGPIDLALIHGWGFGAAVWRPFVTALIAHSHSRRWRIHLVDLAGYGAAQNQAGRGFTETAAMLARALPQGGALCGWSLGGLLALQMQCLAPRRFARLILFGGTPRFTQADDWPHAQPPALLKQFAAAIAADPAAALKRFAALANQGDKDVRALTRQLASHLTPPLPSPAALAQGLAWLGEEDLRERVPAIDRPTLLLHGEHDPLMPPAAARWLSDALPNARLELLPGAAHAPFLGAPERCAQLLNDFCHDAPGQ